MVSAEVSFNIFDGIVFGVLAGCALLSLFRGFIREVLSLFAWVGAAFFTLYNAERVTALLKPTLQSETASLIVGTLLCYFGALIAISIVNAVLLRYIKPGKEVGGVDNILGLLFGIFKGGLIVILGFFVLTIVYNEATYPDWIKQAWSRRHVEDATKSALPLMPKYLRGLSSLSSPEDRDEAGVKVDGAARDAGDGPPVSEPLQRLIDGARGATSATTPDGGPITVTPE